ncbi:hypothetical protein [Duganella callida]|uniref:Uncharacterized protein n=1 Tax=Duganella callida TaxID=2561932 RepID=A0A4Y9SW32_9BURK|nr:hypothetical protein [Duganella callida]TFW30934.1 hypothetical protein E4L98_01310 [Duganella callida]
MAAASCFFTGICVLVLAGCAATEPAADDAPKVAASARCLSQDAPTGSYIKRGCGAPSDAQPVDAGQFLNTLQTSGVHTGSVR